MEDTCAGRSSSDSVTTLNRAMPQKVEKHWQSAEIDLFRHVKACYKIAKIDPPREFIDAIRQGDVETTIVQIEGILSSDIRMSNKLKRNCRKWISNRRSS